MIVLIKKAKDNKIIKKYIQQLRIKKHKRLLQNHQSKSQLERIVIIKKSSHLIKIIEVLFLHQIKQIKMIIIRILRFHNLI
jgi:hypothetical protein